MFYNTNFVCFFCFLFLSFLAVFFFLSFFLFRDSRARALLGVNANKPVWYSNFEKQICGISNGCNLHVLFLNAWCAACVTSLRRLKPAGSVPICLFRGTYSMIDVKWCQNCLTHYRRGDGRRWLAGVGIHLFPDNPSVCKHCLHLPSWFRKPLPILAPAKSPRPPGLLQQAQIDGKQTSSDFKLTYFALSNASRLFLKSQTHYLHQMIISISDSFF